MGPSEPPPPAPAESAAPGSAPAGKPPSRLVLYAKLVALAVVVAYAVAFIVENDRQITVHFVFGTARVSLIWEILLVLAVGLLAGLLLPQLHRHRRRAWLRQQRRQTRSARPDVGGGGEAEGEPR